MSKFADSGTTDNVRISETPAIDAPIAAKKER